LNKVEKVILGLWIFGVPIGAWIDNQLKKKAGIKMGYGSYVQ